MELRDRLLDLGARREDTESQLRQVRREIGAVLIEVRDAEEITLTEAAKLLGVSRATVYYLLEDAGGAA